MASLFACADQRSSSSGSLDIDSEAEDLAHYAMIGSDRTALGILTKVVEAASVCSPDEKVEAVDASDDISIVPCESRDSEDVPSAASADREKAPKRRMIQLVHAVHALRDRVATSASVLSQTPAVGRVQLDIAQLKDDAEESAPGFSFLVHPANTGLLPNGDARSVLSQLIGNPDVFRDAFEPDPRGRLSLSTRMAEAHVEAFKLHSLAVLEALSLSCPGLSLDDLRGLEFANGLSPGERRQLVLCGERAWVRVQGVAGGSERCFLVDQRTAQTLVELIAVWRPVAELFSRALAAHTPETALSFSRRVFPTLNSASSVAEDTTTGGRWMDLFHRDFLAGLPLEPSDRARSPVSDPSLGEAHVHAGLLVERMEAVDVSGESYFHDCERRL